MSRLSRDRIVSAALEIADREGISGLTMRAVAHAVGAPVMSLYHHVGSKDDLLDAISDAALGEIEIPAADGPWERRLAALVRSLRGTLLRHPSLGQLFADRALSGPNAFRAADAVLATLRGAGFAPREAVDAYTAVLTYTLGSGIFQTARSGERSPPEAERLRLERMDALDPSEHPALAEVAEHMAVRGTEEQFEYGLSHLLAGLRADLTGGSRRRRAGARDNTAPTG